QHGRRIGGGAAGNVEADRFDGAPAPAEFDTQRVGEVLVPRQLPAVETFDPVAGEFERLERRRIAGLYRRVDLPGTNAQARSVEIEPVELACRFNQRQVTAFGHVIDNEAGGGLDVGGYLAL